MKTKIIGATVFIFVLCAIVYLCKPVPKIELPEEANQITANDTLKGYYDSKGTLHIEFNNKRNQQ